MQEYELIIGQILYPMQMPSQTLGAVSGAAVTHLHEQATRACTGERKMRVDGATDIEKQWIQEL